MAPLMPQVLEPLAAATGARFEIVALENSLFGSSVTTAGLLPGRRSGARSSTVPTSISRCSRPRR